MSEQELKELDLVLDEAMRLACRQMCRDHGAAMLLIIGTVRKILWTGHAKREQGKQNE